MDKRRREPQHVDFFAVTKGQVVQVSIPVEFVGTPTGVKNSGGLLDIQKREVTINILPRLIPNQVDLDISALDMGDSLHVSDLVANLPEEAELLDDPESTLITIVAPRVAAETTEDIDSAEPEVIAKGKEEDEE